MKKNIFLTTIFFFVLMLMSVATAQAQQDDYMAALRAYLQARPSVMSTFDRDKLISSLEPLNNQVLLGFDSEKLKDIVQKYREEQFYEDFIESVFLPGYKPNVSISELEQLTSMMQSPEGQQYESHTILARKKMEENPDERIQFMSKATDAMRTGRVPQDLKKRKDIPKKYAELFYENIDMASINDMLSPLLNVLNLQKADDEQKKMREAIFQYVTRNMGTLMLNFSYGILTEEDLIFQGRLLRTEAAQHVMVATKHLMGNIFQSTQDWMSKYVEWLVKQKPVCDFSLQKAVDAMNVAAIGVELEDAIDDTKFSSKLEDEMFVMEVSDDSIVEGGVEGLPVSSREIIKSSFYYSTLTQSKDFLHSLVYSGRKFVIRLTGSNGERAVDMAVENSQLKKILDDFDTYHSVFEALNLLGDNNYDEALPILKAAAEKGNQRACYELGKIYYDGIVVNEDFDEAMRYFKQAAELDDELLFKSESFSNIALILLTNNSYEEALTAVDAAIAVIPDEASCYEVKGFILLAKGDKQGAKQMWEKVVSLEPDYTETHPNNLSQLLSGKGKGRK